MGVPTPPAIKKTLREIGGVIGRVLPKNYGFVLLIAPFGDDPGEMSYISNGRREDMEKLLHEFLYKSRTDKK